MMQITYLGPRARRSDPSTLLDVSYFDVQRRLSETERITRTGVVRDGCHEWAADDACYFAEMGEADRAAREGRG